MKHTRLGCAMALALLVFAVFASTASAKVFNAEVGPVEIQGAQVTENVITIEGGLTVKCKKVTYTGQVSSAVKELEVTPSFGECTAFGLAATVSVEGCKLRFDATATDVDVVCPEGKAIKAVTVTCEVQLGSQNGLKGVTYVNNSGPPKTMNVEASVSSITYNKTKDGIGCPLAGTGSKSDGQLAGNNLVKGFIGAEQVGIFLDAAGVFNAEVGTISISGAATEPFVFTIENGMGIECASATYSGSVNKAVALLEVQPSYSECGIFGAPATVSMEGCKFRFDANASDVDLVCPVGKVVKVVVGTCEVQFAEQSGLEGVVFVNNSGPPKTVTVDAAVKSIKYNKTKDGKLCPLAGLGEKSDGEFEGDTLVKAFQGEKQLGVFVG